MIDWDKCLAKCAAGYASTLMQVRDANDPEGYPKEANAVRLLANELERQKRNVVLEAEYWSRYRKGSSDKKSWHRSYADIWCKEDPEMFVEVKLAGLWQDPKNSDHYTVGSKSEKVFKAFADDVWYLLTLSQPNVPRRTDVAFVVVVFGDFELKFPPRTCKQPGDRDADTAWEAIVKCHRKQQPLHELCKVAASRLGANVHARCVEPIITWNGRRLHVGSLALTWSCEERWSTTWGLDHYAHKEH